MNINSNILTWVLVHEHGSGADAYLFTLNGEYDEDAIIERLGVNYEPELGERVVISVINNATSVVPHIDLEVTIASTSGEVLTFLSDAIVRAEEGHLPTTLQTAADALCQMSDDFLAENVLNIPVEDLDRDAFDANFKSLLSFHGPHAQLSDVLAENGD